MKNDINHVGIIMDGNRRWAKEKGVSRFLGHKAGVDNVKKIIRLCSKKGINIMTIYALSTENWLKRSKDELSGLMRLIREFLMSERRKLQKEGVKLNILGDISVFPESLRNLIEETVDMLKDNKNFVFNIALNYGGRDEIVRAVKKILKKGAGEEDINEQLISDNLDTGGLPDPDLIIRTGKVQRTSNFLIWQAAYSELYFPSIYWPEFNEDELDKAISEFNSRKRRFGGNDQKK